MLQCLEIENVGPAPAMRVEFAPRVNLITGDNGLGKSFLLDTAWWALTGAWPADVNRRMTSGLPARPSNLKQRATIRWGTRYGSEISNSSVNYSPAEEAWTPKGWLKIAALVVYAHADGSFSVWDTARNGSPRWPSALNPKRRPPYVFTGTEVWDGLKAAVDGRTVPLCNGLLHDWSSWLKAGDARSKAMARALRALSPAWDGGDRLEPGPTVRLSIDDARDIPSIRTSYAGSVPILHASAGIRRVVALAYMLTWTWSEHRIAAELRGEEVVRHVTMLFDEVESHLHPRWQRSILRALRDVGELLDGAKLQLIASTHAPLVMASAEPWFDPEVDAWFDLDLDGDPPQARLQRRSYTPRGAPGAWLTSEAFDLATERGSVEAESAILRARELLKQSNPPLDDVMDVHAQLRAVLPDIDRFWVRWNAFVERCEGHS